MKWVYLTFAVLGGLAPTAYLYARTYASAENKVGAFDLGLIFLGLGLILLQRGRRPSATLAAQGEHQYGARHSWVTRDLGKQGPPTPTPGQEDISRHGPQPPTR